MKVYFEASVDEEHQGVITVDGDLLAEYEALATDAERHQWLKKLVEQQVYDGDDSVGRSIENCEWQVQE